MKDIRPVSYTHLDVYKRQELPNLSGNDAFEVVDAAVADLQNVEKNGGTYTLATDLTGDFTISATKEVIILSLIHIYNGEFINSPLSYLKR